MDRGETVFESDEVVDRHGTENDVELPIPALRTHGVGIQLEILDSAANAFLLRAAGRNFDGSRTDVKRDERGTVFAVDELPFQISMAASHHETPALLGRPAASEEILNPVCVRPPGYPCVDVPLDGLKIEPGGGDVYAVFAPVLHLALYAPFVGGVSHVEGYGLPHTLSWPPSPGLGKAFVRR